MKPRSFTQQRYLQVFTVVLTAWLLLPKPLVQGFGKNKINYENFHWVIHETPHFIIYYYEESKDLIITVENIAENAYLRISRYLDHELTEKIPIILYRTHRDMEQTNIILDFIPEGVAGFNEPIKNRLVIPAQMSLTSLEKLLTHELVHSFQFDMIYGTRLGEIRDVPLWIMEGMAEHIAGEWNPIDLMVLRDAVGNDSIPDLSQLESFDYLSSAYLGYKLSHSAMDYIVRTYGVVKFRNFIWEVRRTLPTERSLDQAVQRAFGVRLKQLSTDWRRSVQQQIGIERLIQEFPSDYSEPFITANPKLQYWVGPTPSPGGQLLAFISYYQNRTQILAAGWPKMASDLKIEEGDRFTKVFYEPECLTCNIRPWRFLNIITQGRPLAWAPDGESIVFFGRVEYENKLFILNVLTGNLRGGFDVGAELGTSPSFLPDGRILFSGYLDKVSDLLIFDPITNELTRLTDDQAIDECPAVSPDGEWVAYSSERDGEFKIVVKSLRSPEEYFYSPGSGDSALPAWSPDSKRIVFVSDVHKGLNNIFSVDLETGAIIQHTDVFTGNSTPSYSMDGESIIFSSYSRSRWEFVKIPKDHTPAESGIMGPTFRAVVESYMAESTEPLLEKDADDTAVPPESAEPYIATSLEPQANKKPFKIMPDVIDAELSYSSDGVARLLGGIILSDMLGNHRLYLEASRYTSASNFWTEYYYLRYRPDFGLRVFSLADYYYYYGRYVRKLTGAAFIANYPLQITHRIDLTYQFIRRSDDYPQGKLQYDVSLLQVSFNGDTVFFADYGAHSGRRYSLGYGLTVPTTGDTLDFDLSYLDFRQYLPLTRRSEVAWLVYGIMSNGENPDISYLGGAGTIRGYDYGEFVGTRAAYANVELRFPLLDTLRFAGGLVFSGIRGCFFVDSGVTWFKEDELDLLGTDDSPGAPKHLNSSVGFGVVWNLLGLELHFDFSKLTDFAKVDSDTIYEFTIRRNY